MKHCLFFHLLAEERGRRLRELDFRLARDALVVAAEHDNTAGDVARGDNWVHNCRAALHALYRLDVAHIARVCRKAAARLHEFLDNWRDAPLKVFPFGHARRRHDVVAVADKGRQARNFCENLRVLSGKVR